MTDPLERIAAALERLAPPRTAHADPIVHPAYRWQSGALIAAERFAPLPLDALLGIDRQKAALCEEVRRLASRHAAQDVLLWGARGTGKSALVKSAVAAVQAVAGVERLGLVEVADVAELSALFPLLAARDRGFVLFLDDIAFDSPAEARRLRSLLDGGAEARPANTRLVVTSNRRHLLPRDIEEQSRGLGAPNEPGAINPRDAVDDQLALADRFGLSLGFHVLDQDGYLAIVRGYATRHALPFDAADAVRWATRRGSRSGRVAWQYAVDLAGREGRAL